MAKPKVLRVEREQERVLRAVFEWHTTKIIFVADKNGNPVISARINTEGARGSEGTYIPPSRYNEMIRMASAIFGKGPKKET